jgi:hypothetical protein
MPEANHLRCRRQRIGDHNPLRLDVSRGYLHAAFPPSGAGIIALAVAIRTGFHWDRGIVSLAAALAIRLQLRRKRFPGAISSSF